MTKLIFFSLQTQMIKKKNVLEIFLKKYLVGS